jgi:hypothetical protein
MASLPARGLFCRNRNGRSPTTRASQGEMAHAVL